MCPSECHMAALKAWPHPCVSAGGARILIRLHSTHLLSILRTSFTSTQPAGPQALPPREPPLASLVPQPREGARTGGLSLARFPFLSVTVSREPGVHGVSS